MPKGKVKWPKATMEDGSFQFSIEINYPLSSIVWRGSVGSAGPSYPCPFLYSSMPIYSLSTISRKVGIAYRTVELMIFCFHFIHSPSSKWIQWTLHIKCVSAMNLLHFSVFIRLNGAPCIHSRGSDNKYPTQNALQPASVEHICAGCIRACCVSLFHWLFPVVLRTERMHASDFLTQLSQNLPKHNETRVNNTYSMTHASNPAKIKSK